MVEDKGACDYGLEVVEGRELERRGDDGLGMALDEGHGDSWRLWYMC